MNNRKWLCQRCFTAVAGVVMLIVLGHFLPEASSKADPDPVDMLKLGRGEVVVALRQVDDVRYVSGTIIINEAPDKVWRILVNPYEFQGKICPRMRSVEVLKDLQELSVLKCTVDVVFPIPSITYLVESKYVVNRIDFRRVGGSLKDFRGQWLLVPLDGGQKTQCIYSMYLDPGFFVPQWIIREGVKQELPRTLVALRERVTAVYQFNEAPASPNILAAALSHPVTLQQPHLQIRNH